MYVSHKRCSACSYQRASVNGIANQASSTQPRYVHHNPMQWPSAECRAFSPNRNVVQSRQQAARGCHESLRGGRCECHFPFSSFSPVGGCFMYGGIESVSRHTRTLSVVRIIAVESRCISCTWPLRQVRLPMPRAMVEIHCVSCASRSAPRQSLVMYADEQ